MSVTLGGNIQGKKKIGTDIDVKSEKKKNCKNVTNCSSIYGSIFLEVTIPDYTHPSMATTFSHLEGPSHGQMEISAIARNLLNPVNSLRFVQHVTEERPKQHIYIRRSSDIWYIPRLGAFGAVLKLKPLVVVMVVVKTLIKPNSP